MKDHIILVTGGSGFVGVHIVLQLLQQGYRVRTTLRDLSKQDTVLKALRDGGIADPEPLQFFQAELTSDQGWKEAMKDVDYVLHVASPFPAKQPEDESELIIPAREGALRVLRAARDAGVKRVVLTSSFAAIGYSNNLQGHVFTEEDWTDEADPLMPYIKSKTVAEKAAWNFIETEARDLELTVINPVGIFGPVIGDISSASLDSVVKEIMTGAVSQSPEFTFGVVDVRDVADIHIKAMLHPDAKGQRFLATADGVMSFYDVAELIKKERPELAAGINRIAPTPERFYINLSNEKARQVLTWQPKSKEEALLASADSIAKTLF
ncbi:SDR family oxidoreductase [Mucilaginibacter aquatilis]|uniref:NAD-dependent epimerase/dehydratase family protein n=1 Tax=Mucilaginibacter aquatilis TaxID=1517760 RepID=A0A6I4I930_9SPHI|nr:aldehyde reductase [Mucilaginibacter aquatilis]MVN91447.1 NAD-dependent epimerase/dehydratase family protein [Mucilaginibacter aquatilis]